MAARAGRRRPPQLQPAERLLLLGLLYKMFSLRSFPYITAGLIAFLYTIFHIQVHGITYDFESGTEVSLPTIEQACFKPKLFFQSKVSTKEKLERFFLAPLYHANFAHLIGNLFALLQNAHQIERDMGRLQLGVLTLFLTVATQCTDIGVSYIAHAFHLPVTWFHECSVGFSGVIFAYMAIVSLRSDGYQLVGDGRHIRVWVPNKIAFWVQLILLSRPGISFIGHLSGCIVGYITWKASPHRFSVAGMTLISFFLLLFAINLPPSL
eukprot:TRINITY_DN81710_c0_g1_i1.p1 TRINITY_DN81710_c0_g1~~TRINITY_DN81710_c0_g1_i1.p1  ORF type:complete len:293 (-),score=40.17 TRINITY_DN81710_c0_g1_i1:24-821(-)